MRNPSKTLFVLVAAVIVAGCVFSVPEPVLIREPRPEPVPLRIGVFFPPEFRDFTYRHHLTDTAWILGKPSVRLVSEALALLFAEVVDVPRPGSGGVPQDVAGIIEPRIASAAVVYWSEEAIKRGERLQPVHVTYAFTLRTPAGQQIASWQVTGRGNEFAANPLGAVQTLKRNFEQSMRDAMWGFTSGFRDVPDVRRWLAERRVR